MYVDGESLLPKFRFTVWYFTVAILRGRNVSSSKISEKRLWGETVDTCKLTSANKGMNDALKAK